LKKLVLALGIVFALLLFGCLGSSGTPAFVQAPAAAGATVSAATSTPTATPTATPIGQIQQTATPTSVAASFNLDAVKAKVEASVAKMFPTLAPFSLDQYTDTQFGVFYKKEVTAKEGGLSVIYSFTVRRAIAEELRPAAAAKYPSVTQVNGVTVYYELVNEGTAAQVSRGDVACAYDGVNKGFVFFEIGNKVMNKAGVEGIFKELLTAC